MNSFCISLHPVTGLHPPTSEHSSSQPNLFTRIYDEESINIQISDVCKIWQKVAEQKKVLCLDINEQGQFKVASELCSYIDNYLAPENRKVLICSDDPDFKNMQAIGIFQDDYKIASIDEDKDKHYVNLTFLVTNPINIRSDVNTEEARRVSGAGQAVIRALVLHVKETSQDGIYVNATEEAFGFYEKMHFQRPDSRSVCRKAGIDQQKLAENGDSWLEYMRILPKHKIDQLYP